MKNIIIFLALLSLVLSTTIVSAQKKKPVATIFKPVGAVTFKTETKDWLAAKPATPLISGDLVRTDENSFAIIKFLENSVLRVQEKSEVTISGEITSNREFSKNVYLQRGELGFDVKKRPNEKFEFSTPTSVASIRGTGGLLISGLDSNDVLILGSGIVEFKNLLSKFVTTVTGGQTAYSFSNGTIVVNESTPEEKRLLDHGTNDSGKTEGSNLKGGQDSAKTSATGIKVGLTLNAPVSKENQNMIITVEITESSLSLDSLKMIGGNVSLFYQPKAGQGFKTLTAQLSDRSTKFTVPAADVFAPSINAYATLKLKDGSEFSSPSASPESNPHSFAVQAGNKNELKIDFTDPNGKKKTMIIEYK